MVLACQSPHGRSGVAVRTAVDVLVLELGGAGEGAERAGHASEHVNGDNGSGALRESNGLGQKRCSEKKTRLLAALLCHGSWQSIFK